MKNSHLAFVCVFLLGSSASAFAQESFSTPDDAVAALVDAAKAGDQQRIVAILGPGGSEVANSGDEVADRNAREKFVSEYDAKHALEAEADGTQTLMIGDEAWPFPIPLANKDAKWQFDTKAGLNEILRRRVGKNELSAIQVCLSYVQAQNDYAALDPACLGPHTYAERIVSRPGKKDGLYWPTTADQPQSPLGDLAAQASAEGYRVGNTPIPFHGYYYRILKRQGPAAGGGAYDYIVNGKMIGGFALVAFPAEYGNSGIMTFIVNQDGQVFQKDLGAQTDKLAREISSFSPDSSWTKADAPSP